MPAPHPVHFGVRALYGHAVPTRRRGTLPVGQNALGLALLVGKTHHAVLAYSPALSRIAAVAMVSMVTASSGMASNNITGITGIRNQPSRPRKIQDISRTLQARLGVLSVFDRKGIFYNDSDLATTLNHHRWLSYTEAPELIRETLSLLTSQHQTMSACW